MLPNAPVGQTSDQRSLTGAECEACGVAVEGLQALRQRAEDLNRENHIRALQLALHADSEKVWNMTVWFW